MLIFMKHNITSVGVYSMGKSKTKEINTVYVRLLKAALDCFLADEYHKVTTRLIAEKADVNISMIRYYFGNKEGLYEEMIRDTLAPLLDSLDNKLISSAHDMSDFFRLYYDTMTKYPDFPKLILKVLALNQGPGKRFIQQLLERGRSSGIKKIEGLVKQGKVDGSINPDVVRLSFVSLAMMPMLLKSIFEEQMETGMDDDFIMQLANFNGQMLTTGLTQSLK